MLIGSALAGATDGRAERSRLLLGGRWGPDQGRDERRRGAAGNV